MTEPNLGPIVSGDEIGAELRRRKSKDIYKVVAASTKKLIAEKVKLEEADGWRDIRKNAKSTRMAKLKPADEQLEDEVWSILAQMGFKEMSKGRQFLVAVEDGLPPRQIDVFAKDDETVVIVECTQKDAPGKKNMANLIEKMRSIREPVLKSIRTFYGKSVRLKVKLVIATKNILWNQVDLDKCKESQIAVISDSEIDYYKSLAQHLKHAARYQFLAHMFGGQKIEGLATQVVATRGKMGGETFYTFLIRPDYLLKIAYVGHKASRDIESLGTYQRMLQPKRLSKIAEYINDGGKFPTNIVVNLKTAKRSELRFDEKEKVGEESLGILHLPANYASAWIIDGQHRLYGYAYARHSAGFAQDKTTIPVLAYQNLPAKDEMDLFIDINSKQVKVSPGLLVELYADLHWCSSDPEEAFQALLSRISSRLNTLKTSPLFDRMVVTGKKKTSYRCLTQTSVRDGLEVAKLLGTFSKGAVVPGPLSTAKTDEYNANLQKGISVICDSFRLFAIELASHWTIGDGPGGYLCTNNGIRALFHVIRDVADHIRAKDGSDLYLLTADETFAEVSPYLQALVDYFKAANAQEIQSFRRIGSSLTAVRQQSFGLEAHIQAKFADFRPPGLQEYLDSRDVAGTEESAAKVTKIHRRLFDYVISTLKKRYGTHRKAWWTEGIPLKIRQECTAAWEEKNRVGEEESQLYLISYIDICIGNWELVKDVVSLDAKDKTNKKANTKWIKELNDIRQMTTHPERGVLSKEQVAFVNETFEKVEKFIPEQNA
ncbi:MAG: DGQHR domain-containing protein [Mesorhizobium sp.]|uniref:DGQHR domain-containing protein n=1 Tax=Mesorhizobium sp. TaxID=1871066 RepID=UPI000FE5DA96|nr:DGQHR domain-containing protein [Mesorhizobium sp.]RWP83806.1 MAG: DGQHR domain-containing protein [Mesorhizobium sp.]